jgi:hypothetical protein
MVPEVVGVSNQPAAALSDPASAVRVADPAAAAAVDPTYPTYPADASSVAPSRWEYQPGYANGNSSGAYSGPQASDSRGSQSPTEPVSVAIVPVLETEPAPPSLSGELALFYRVSHSSGSQDQKWTGRVVSGDSVVFGGNISWENGSKGLVRLIPSTGQVDLLKTIASPSWSKASLYPVTFEGRLFAIKDQGADWTSKNKRFDIEELDPVTGRTLSRTTVTAEWLTVVGDQLYYQTKTEEDFWGSGRITGGQVRAMTLGDHLVSLTDNGLRRHDLRTGEVIGETPVNPGLMSNMWPSQYSIFYGDDSVYWARETGESTDIHIIRLPADGEPEGLLTFEMDGTETGLTIDAHQGKVTVGVTSSVPPTGLAVTQVFLMDLVTRTAEELVINEHIPASTIEVGGGLQMMIMP